MKLFSPTFSPSASEERGCAFVLSAFSFQLSKRLIGYQEGRERERQRERERERVSNGWDMRGRVELGEERWPEALEVFREAWSRITAPAEYGELPRDPLGGLRATRWERSEPKAKLLNKPRASLVMERVPLATKSDAKVEQEDGTLWETEECECDDDNACLSLTGAKDQMSQHYYDFHILYNASFRVPELFLLGYREGMMTLAWMSLLLSLSLSLSLSLARSNCGNRQNSPSNTDNVQIYLSVCLSIYLVRWKCLDFG